MQVSEAMAEVPIFYVFAERAGRFFYIVLKS
jgi:hypothetical protein